MPFEARATAPSISRPAVRSDLGRKGGQKNRIVKTPESRNEPPKIPQNVSEIDEMLREAFALCVLGG